MRRFMMLASLCVLFAAAFWVDGKEPKDTPKAAETRKKLQQKISVDFADTKLEDALEEIKDQVKNLKTMMDKGVSVNRTLKFKAQNMTVEKVLDGMFKSTGLGYYVISQDGNAYDGLLKIRMSNERGYPAGEEPTKTTKGKDKGKDKGDSDKTAAKDKDKGKKKTTTKEKKTEDNDAAAKESTEDSAEKAEQDAARKLKLAKILLDDGLTAKAKARFEEIIKNYPKTKAAEKAQELLKDLEK